MDCVDEKAIVLHDENGHIFTMTYTQETAKESVRNIMVYLSDYTLPENFDIEYAYDETEMTTVDTGKFSEFVFAKTVNPSTGELYQVYGSIWTIYY